MQTLLLQLIAIHSKLYLSLGKEGNIQTNELQIIRSSVRKGMKMGGNGNNIAEIGGNLSNNLLKTVMGFERE